MIRLLVAACALLTMSVGDAQAQEWKEKAAKAEKKKSAEKAHKPMNPDKDPQLHDPCLVNPYLPGCPEQAFKSDPCLLNANLPQCPKAL